MTRYALPAFGAVFLHTGLAAANPFTDGRPTPVPVAPPGSSTPFLPEILAIQRHIHESMTAQLTALRDGSSLTPLWLLLAISFAYGVFHVLAPGHGKVIVGSYFLGNRARWREAISAGAIMAIGHTITAVAIVTVLYLILGLGQLRVLSDARYVELAGYGAIAVIGCWLFWRSWHGSKPGCSHCGHHHHPHGHDDHHTHHHEHAHADSNRSARRGTSLFAATSLVPCTGSMIILLFTLAQQILWAGILAVLAIALGMALTVTAIALVAIFLHRRLAGETDTPQPLWRQRLQRGLGLAAALIVILTGGTLFSGTLMAMLP